MNKSEMEANTSNYSKRGKTLASKSPLVEKVARAFLTNQII